MYEIGKIYKMPDGTHLLCGMIPVQFPSTTYVNSQLLLTLGGPQYSPPQALDIALEWAAYMQMGHYQIRRIPVEKMSQDNPGMFIRLDAMAKENASIRAELEKYTGRELWDKGLLQFSPSGEVINDPTAPDSLGF